MNIGGHACLILAIIFGVLALVFTVMGEKAAILISGFTSIDKKQRELYDKKQMCKDERNSFLLWMLIMIVGSILSYLIASFLAIAAFIVWIFIFFKEVSLDPEKAFERYKNK